MAIFEKKIICARLLTSKRPDANPSTYSITYDVNKIKSNNDKTKKKNNNNNKRTDKESKLQHRIRHHDDSTLEVNNLARSQGGRRTTPNLPKGPLLATKWAKNGVFVGRLRG